MRILKYLFFLFTLTILVSCSANNNYGLRLENDIIGGSDRDYTHGTFFNHSVSYEKASEFTKRTASLLPSFRVFDSDPEELTRIKTEVGQEIHTPEDLKRKDLIENDAPYAGFLYGKLIRVNATKDFRLETGLTLGLVGSSAYAAEVQRFVHNDLGRGTDPRGWPNQLNDEPILNMHYLRSRSFLFTKYSDALSEIKFRLGNAYTDSRYTNGVRVGYNLPAFDGSHSSRPSAYLYGLSHLDLIGRNIFYDGNTWRKSHSVKTKHFVGSLEGGIGLGYQGYSFKFKYIVSSKTFEEQKEDHHGYGGISFGLDW